ncbi:MAG: TauD/TfdA family dioxygenase, partial [Pseudomonadota bacterium]
MQNADQLDIKPLSGTFGAEVRGAELSRLDTDGFKTVYQLMVEHQVVVFRDQHFDPEDYLEFAQKWGELHRHPFMQGLEDYPEILEIVKTESDTMAFGNTWHTDQSFTEKPSKFTMLYAKEVPQRGGDTMFTNMYAAYDSLSDGMKSMLGNLRGWNVGSRQKLRSASTPPSNAKPLSNMQEQAPPEGLQTEASHPLVRTHKDSGRKAL